MLLVLVGALALVLTSGLPGGGSSRAAAQPASVEPTPQTDASVPASDVTMIGAAPLEAPGTNETWGVGDGGLHHGGGPLHQGKRLVARTGPAGRLQARSQSPLAGQMTPQGDGVLAGTVSPEGGGSHQALLVRKPGGAFLETPRVPAEGETLPAGEKACCWKAKLCSAPIARR